MTTICPKCRAVRPADTSAPDWQCPSCGVAYAKAGGSAPVLARTYSTTKRSERQGLPWGKIIMVLAIAYGAWNGYQNFKGRSGGDVGSIATRIAGNISTEQLGALAGSTQPADVLFYSAPWCANCTEAKGWLKQYGFKYDECNIEASSDCASRLRALGSDGVPYLIVKGHHMKDGFDSEEFIAALRKK